MTSRIGRVPKSESEREREREKPTVGKLVGGSGAQRQYRLELSQKHEWDWWRPVKNKSETDL